MGISFREKEGRPTEIKMSNAMSKEYMVVEKVYEEPLSGSGTGTEGAFEWKLYSLMLHECKYFDEASEGMKVDKFDPPKQVSFFKSAKTFCEKFDALPLNTIVKVSQVEVPGKAYKEFAVEKTGEGNASAPEADKNASVTPAQYIKQMKGNGLDLGAVTLLTKQNYPEQTDATIKAIYESV